MSDNFQKPLKADEIEALLRAAREQAGRADFVSNEPLGPGDVQHLRNMDLPDDALAGAGWPYDAASAEELLHRAEHHLAEAMSTEEKIAPRQADPIPTRPSPAHSFPPIAPDAAASAPAATGLPLSVIGDLELDVTLELGRAELMIEDLLALREGSVVTLDKEAGEPIDILANGKLIARGEVIVVDDKFCVRICEVIGSR